jgi:hypothetical protein
MGKYLNGLKQGDALTPLLLNFALECSIKKVQGNQIGRKLNGTYQLLVYDGNANLPEDNINAIKKKHRNFNCGNKVGCSRSIRKGN